MPNVFELGPFGRLVIPAWGRNIGNRIYFISAYDLSSYGFDQYVVSHPRAFGVTVRYRSS